MRVGFVGLGNMGLPMATNLLAAGFELHVYNRTHSKTRALRARGASVAKTTAQLVREADLVLACLADVAACEAVFLGADGLIDNAEPGQILIDHSTVDLRTCHRLHAAASDRGIGFLDAPVSGGAEGAAAATLTIMVGGDAAVLGRARPVLEALADRVEHMGGAGAGTATKLANQLLVGAHTLAAAEALALGAATDVDPAKLLSVLGSSWGDSRMLRRNGPLIHARDFRPSGVPIRNLVKDLGIVVELAQSLGLRVPTAREALRIHERAAAQGSADDDIAAVVRQLQRDRVP